MTTPKGPGPYKLTYVASAIRQKVEGPTPRAAGGKYHNPEMLADLNAAWLAGHEAARAEAEELAKALERSDAHDTLSTEVRAALAKWREASK